MLAVISILFVLLSFYLGRLYMQVSISNQIISSHHIFKQFNNLITFQEMPDYQFTESEIEYIKDMQLEFITKYGEPYFMANSVDNPSISYTEDKAIPGAKYEPKIDRVIYNTIAVNNTYLHDFPITLDDGSVVDNLNYNQMIVPYNLRSQIKIGDTVSLKNEVLPLANDGQWQTVDYEVIGYSQEGESYFNTSGLEYGYKQIDSPIIGVPPIKEMNTKLNEENYVYSGSFTSQLSYNLTSEQIKEVEKEIPDSMWLLNISDDELDDYKFVMKQVLLYLLVAVIFIFMSIIVIGLITYINFSQSNYLYSVYIQLGLKISYIIYIHLLLLIISFGFGILIIDNLVANNIILSAPSKISQTISALSLISIYISILSINLRYAIINVTRGNK